MAREFKLDVDPTWSDATVATLAAVAGLVIIDFKERGDHQLAARLSTACPEAIFEDPPAGSQHRHIARDRSLLTTADVESAARRGEAVNLKAPRMGGPLAVLSALALARRWGVQAYVGGMFEIGPGREQARQLAALFTGAAPNDLGPDRGRAVAAAGGFALPDPARSHRASAPSITTGRASRKLTFSSSRSAEKGFCRNSCGQRSGGTDGVGCQL